MEETIDVLLATYNGEKYLAEQIESILNQTYKNIRILISDDCSKDNTREIIKEYQKKDSRIHAYFQENNLGYIKNFEFLIKQVKSNMFMGVSYNNRTISRNYIIYVEIETGNIIFRNTSYSALADFKTWLKSQYDAGTPVVIYYKLATPTKLAFTDEQKAVAKELNNARTYKNVTNITTDSIAILDLDYAKDLEELTEYSTEERVIGRWIDGKPLYSKVGSIKFTSVYDSSGLHTRGSLIDSDIDYGTVSKVLNKNLLSSSLFNTYGTSTSNVYVENRQGNSNKGYILGFTDRTDLLNTTIYVVVEYTKTTD